MMTQKVAGDERDGYDFRLVSTSDGNWHERRIFLDGRLIIIRIGTAPGLLQMALPHAIALCADPPELASPFRDFKSSEAELNRLFAEEIRKLEIDTIDFVNPKRVDTAECPSQPNLGVSAGPAC
jgi:hypothetical protein